MYEIGQLDVNFTTIANTDFKAVCQSKCLTATDMAYRYCAVCRFNVAGSIQDGADCIWTYNDRINM